MQTFFNILVTGSPTQSQAHLSAIRFINTVLSSGHRIKSVFFYQDAVNVANKFIIKPNDEFQLSQHWVLLSQKYQFELQVCVAASNRRGVISSEEAKQNTLDCESINPGFTITGLGQLAVAFADSASLNSKQIQFR